MVCPPGHCWELVCQCVASLPRLSQGMPGPGIVHMSASVWPACVIFDNGMPSSVGFFNWLSCLDCVCQCVTSLWHYLQGYARRGITGSISAKMWPTCFVIHHWYSLSMSVSPWPTYDCLIIHNMDGPVLPVSMYISWLG